MSDRKHFIRTTADLVAAGLAGSTRREDLDRLMQQYAVGITPAMAELIDPEAGLADPIAAQFVPTVAELVRTPAERDDPIGDEAYSPVHGIVHRYRDRCLLKLVSICPVYCRFCFRREMVGPAHGSQLTASELDAAFSYIAQHPEIWEVIVTGGDPLILSARRLKEITGRLEAIGHVKIVRWHTRVPVVDPGRVDEDMASALRSSGKTVYVALHANHPRELTPAARRACARLIDAGVAMVSQSVLLKGVNDDVDTLEELMRAFVEIRIRPYYLHHPDMAPGTSHFRLPIARGQELVGQLRQRLSGLAMPAYVLDIPGGHGKVPIGPAHLRDGVDGYEVIDRKGNTHRYRDCCAMTGEE